MDKRAESGGLGRASLTTPQTPQRKHKVGVAVTLLTPADSYGNTLSKEKVCPHPSTDRTATLKTSKTVKTLVTFQYKRPRTADLILCKNLFLYFLIRENTYPAKTATYSPYLSDGRVATVSAYMVRLFIHGRFRSHGTITTCIGQFASFGFLLALEIRQPCHDKVDEVPHLD